MTEKQEEHSPFGRGFIAASIVIGAVFVCGLLLLLTGLTSPSPTASATASTPNPPPADSSTPDRAESAVPEPAVPDTPEPSNRSTSSACGLPQGDQRVPTTPPAVDGWDVSRRVVVPRSRTAGPAKVDADGFRRCFAHSPSGALFAAYNAISAIGDQRKAVATVGKLMLPGPDTDALLRELRQESPNEFTDPTQLAGYRVLDASRDRFTVMLALPVQSEYVSATLTLAWHEGDWRLAPPAPGEPVGAPYSQHRDLAGFVAWSGL
ncbi:hypothetical protein EV643_101817 [Kribbella sp. VKM Ac-2527]|uniref:DUF8175 domain-containing protein n=1 Tax=Kribbella caucasensis TaxID=2512215 RepID=A0A4R6KT59_9ACTN|nr:hypothetical protein [Kribbella sp. VKM Ac-2527]TDO55023.1 hypothetical protein EV643_101817 [Kribbella sp. VKM Ac-2527]